MQPNTYQNLGAPLQYPPSQQAYYPPPQTTLKPQSSWKDVPFIFIFFFTLVGLALIPLVVPKDADYENNNISFHINNSVIAIFACAFAVALGFGLLFVALMENYAYYMIQFALGMNCLFLGALAGLCAYYKIIVGAVIYGIFCLISLLYWYLVQNRIPFTAAILRMSAKIINYFPATYGVAFTSLFVQVGFITAWLFIVAKNTRNENANYLFIYLIFSFYYTCQVIMNTAHVTFSGTVATYYFQGPAARGTSPTLASAQRALSTSFGSICLGSLLVAVIQTIRALVRGASRGSRNGLITCIARCLLSIMERLARIFNTYAFCRVAMYGLSYVEAAKQTWDLLETKGVTILINNNLSRSVIGLGVLVGGASSLAISIPWAIHLHHEDVILSGDVWVICICAFAIGLIVAATMLAAVDSAVATIMVCIADDPARLRELDHDLAAEVTRRYPAMFA